MLMELLLGIFCKVSSRLKDNVWSKKIIFDNSGASPCTLLVPWYSRNFGPKVTSLTPVTCQLFTIPHWSLAHDQKTQLPFDHVCWHTDHRSALWELQGLKLGCLVELECCLSLEPPVPVQMGFLHYHFITGTTTADTDSVDPRQLI